MKNSKNFFRFLILILGLTHFTGHAAVESIVWYQGGIEEAKNLAMVEGKKVLLDFYATWCGPCQRMFNETLVDPRVIDFVNKNYIPVKLDVDSPESAQWEKTYSIKYVPTFLVLSDLGDEEGRVVGFKDSDSFISTLVSFKRFSEEESANMAE